MVISHDVFNDRSGTVIALAITSQRPSVGFPLALEIASVAMPKPSWVKLGQIRTLSVQRIGQKLGTLDSEELDRLVEGLNEIVG